MATTIGLGVKKKETKIDDKTKAKITKLEKENTELKVENQLLREKISKLDANKEPAENKSQAGLKSLRNIYDSGYHICNMYYGSHRESGEDCMFCLDILDNFVNHGQKSRG